MRVVFLGTPAVAVPSLEAIAASAHEVVAVVTQPDRPRGRGRALQPSPVKRTAAALGIPVFQPASPNEEGFAERLAALAPAALAVVAYGHILRPHVLAVAPAVNVHFSLLPAYRGAAPVQRALMDGATRTGVSVFLLEPTVDTGPVLDGEEIEVGPEETAGDLFERLAPIGARVLLRVLDALAAGTAAPRPQDDRGASPAPKITPEETVIDWSRPAEAVVDLIRGLSPRPGASTRFRGKRLGVVRARVADGSGVPGAIIDTGDALIVAAGRGAVCLLEVHPEGKRPMSGADLVRGYRPRVGDVMGAGSD